MSVAGLFVGLATLDVVQQVAELPGSNQKTTAEQTWLAAGGPAAVAAIAFAALGGEARLWTALGDSPVAQLVAADLATAGVRVIDAAPAGFELAASVVLLNGPSGERAVISGSGHRPRLGPVAAPELEGTAVLLCDGHLPELALAAADAAAKARLPLVVDAGSHKPVFEQLLPLATDIICSADYRHPTGRSGSALLQGRVELVAVSNGAAAVEWRTRSAAGVIQPPEVIAVDTVGAGDVLHGAYARALAVGLDRPAALRAGVAAASERVRRPGPFSWRGALASL